MLEVAFAVPGDIESPTGGYAYARKLLELLPDQGVTPRLTELPGSFPHPTAADLDCTARTLLALPPGTVLLADGLAYGALPRDLVAMVQNPVVALVHHPLGLESGIGARRKAELLASEAAALDLARRVIATSGATARCLAAEFGVRPETIAVAEPGVEPVVRARGTGNPVQLLAIGAVSPRKAYDVLVKALSGLAPLDWRLTIAGSLERDLEAARSLERLVASEGLGDRISLAGAVGDGALDALYDRADILVSASLFEGYGMVLAEAMARGVALVASTGGAA
ncbi:MAG: Glycosyl transferase, group 1, partial [uncultured Microvirga sp.]